MNFLQRVPKKYHLSHGEVKYHWLTLRHELLKVGYFLIHCEKHLPQYEISS